MPLYTGAMKWAVATKCTSGPISSAGTGSYSVMLENSPEELPAAWKGRPDGSASCGSLMSKG